MKPSNIGLAAVGLCIMSLGGYLLAAGEVGGYHLLKKVSLGAAPGDTEYFDYINVDSAGRRVYLSHGTEFKVVNTDNFSVVGTISGDFKRNHGIALVPALGQGLLR